MRSIMQPGFAVSGLRSGACYFLPSRSDRVARRGLAVSAWLAGMSGDVPTSSVAMDGHGERRPAMERSLTPISRTSPPGKRSARGFAHRSREMWSASSNQSSVTSYQSLDLTTAALTSAHRPLITDY